MSFEKNAADWIKRLVDQVNAILDRRERVLISSVETDERDLKCTVRGLFSMGCSTFEFDLKGPIELKVPTPEKKPVRVPKIIADPDMPEGEISLRYDGREVGRIVNVK